MTDEIAADIEAIGQLDVVPQILEVMCRTTGMGFAAVARVTSDRWIACAVRDEIGFGLAPGGELQVASTICAEIRDSGAAVVFDQATADPRWRDHHTPRLYGLESYISTPIYHNGAFFGTLCAIDPKPADLVATKALATFELFARLIGSHLDTHARLRTAEADLITAQEVAVLREQFVAVLGHDLRNPLAAIEGGARLLRRDPPAERARFILDQMTGSIARMAALIDDVMDFARGRLGGGFSVQVVLTPPDVLTASLDQLIGESRSANPGRIIEADTNVAHPVACDLERIGQLVSNLVGNALTHGAREGPVRVRTWTTPTTFELSVANAGSPIPETTMAKLFQPFTRGPSLPSPGGLGLGLYIASEIARAHGGALTAHSDAGETVFRFSMPIARAGDERRHPVSS